MNLFTDDHVEGRSAEQAEGLMKLIDILEDNDDVQSVATNAELSDELIQRL